MDISVLHFDHVYEKQSFLEEKDHQSIDLQDIQNTNLFCERDTLIEISNRMKNRTGKINFIGSGNYHYVTYLLLKKIKHPFSLVLFDHHTDTLKSMDDTLISCGSWVLESLERLPNLKKVLILGVSEEGEHHVPPSIESKVSLYTKHFLRLNFEQALKSILQEIPTEHVYISIDKDVLDKRDAVTAWDHGNMRPKQMLAIVKELIKSKLISGIDICGEYPVQGNEFGHEAKEAHKKNNAANQLIMTYIQRWLRQAEHPNEFLHA